MNTRHAFDPPPPGHFCLAVNMIAGGKFLHAGQPMPLSELAAIPPNLRQERYIVRHSNAEPEPEQVVANFQLGTAYSVDQDDRLRRRHVERQAAEQSSAAQFQDAIEEQLADELENPDAVVAAAIEQGQYEHESAVAKQVAEAQAAARRREMDEEAARQYIAEQDAMFVDDSALPAEEQIPVAPGPRKMRKRFVNRQGTWLRAQKLKHRIPGEDVYVRQSKGQFLKIGVVDQAGRLPVCYLEERL